MITTYYSALFVLSMIFLILYVCIWHKHFDITFTMFFTLVPISCLGYVLYTEADSTYTAFWGLRFIYIGGCFLQYFITLSIFNLCEIKIGKIIKIIAFCMTVLLYLSVLSIGHSDLYYKNVNFVQKDGYFILQKEYGVMHSVFYFYLATLFLIGIIVIIYSYIKKSQVSRIILYLLVIPDAITIFSYFVMKKIINTVEFMPLGYVLAEVVYLIIAYRMCLYDINNTAADSLSQTGTIGYISFDFKKKYLGSNATARKIMPFLTKLTVDYGLVDNDVDQRKLLHWLNSFIEDNKNNSFTYIIHVNGVPDDNDDKIYNVSVNYLYDSVRKRGYIISLTDDTANRKYINLLDSYNEKLQDEVQEKTQHIIDMHDNLILSLATMVESRDNSTGGHIRRTSVGVKLLIDEIIKDNEFELSDEFCRNIIKAAPMHDLGKIAVDDAILRKPGRFTDEEFEKMKCHAAEGAKVIHQILEKTDDEAFKVIAENVAHYHHERIDGSGYPDGLKGDEIPIEARIMAIADVYDALVSKRVYKDSMSFEQADSIIMEGMGTQFDERLKKYYVKARPKLEEYYSSQVEG